MRVHAVVTHCLPVPLVSVGVEENVVDPPGLGKNGAKHQGEGNAGDPYPQLLVLCDKGEVGDTYVRSVGGMGETYMWGGKIET